jgi:hypothetical protein
MAESAPESAANRSRITARIGGSSTRGIRNEIVTPQTAKTAPHPGAANTQTGS